MTINEFINETNKQLKQSIMIAIVKPITTLTNKNEIQEIMKKFHDDPIHGGHAGVQRLYAKIHNNYFWKNMKTDISRYINKCIKC